MADLGADWPWCGGLQAYLMKHADGVIFDASTLRTGHLFMIFRAGYTRAPPDPCPAAIFSQVDCGRATRPVDLVM